MTGKSVFTLLGGLGTFFLTCMLGVAPSSYAGAQTSTGTIRGFVTHASGAPMDGATIAARDVETNTVRGAITGATGFYNIAGLRPGSYELNVRRLGSAPRSSNVRVRIGEVVTADFQLADTSVALQAVVVTAAPVIETRTSEVATNITTEQIENLPQNNRNFLALAQQAPGVRVDRNGNFAAGALPADNVNVFIDGVSYKSDILPGGVVGQDPGNQNPAGNPFPQIAVQEFRVITQNYKAEYQKATSAVIVATTKSGGNRWEGRGFWFAQPDGFTSKNIFETQDGRQAPDFKRNQFGLAVGGPIIRDKLHVFGAYEGNYQDRFETVKVGRSGAPPNLTALEGTFVRPFKENLLLGKLSYQAAPRHSFELSGNVRDEYDIRGFGGTRSREGAERLNNDVKTGNFKYQYAGGRFLNEAQASFQRYRFNPVALEKGVVQEFVDFLTIGPKDSEQDLIQDRLALRNDVTTTIDRWGGTHVFKAGANLDLLKYDINKTIFGNPKFFYFGNFTTPAFASFGSGNPQLEDKNTEFGVYLQDDWSIGRKLELNLGIRWDYETNGLNNDYVTPDSIRSLVGAFVDGNKYFTDGNQRESYKGAFQPRLGFSYDLFGNGRMTVFGGGGLYYDRNVFNNTLDEQYRLQYVQYTFLFKEFPGDNRPGRIQFQPSYLSAEGLQALLASGQGGRPEIFLNANDTKIPRSIQTSFGVRQVVGPTVISASYGGVRGKHGFVFIPARNATGGIISGPRFDKILLSSDEAKYWYDALYLKVEKPYVADSKWGGQIAYTLSEAQTDGTDEGQGLFNFDATESTFRKHPTQGDERHRVTANWIRDLPWWGLRFGGLLSLGSGTPFNVITGCPLTQATVQTERTRPGGNPNFEQFCVDKGFYGNGNFTAEDDFASGVGRNSGRPPRQRFIFGDWAFRNVDLRLSKSLDVRGRRLEFVGEVFNAFGFDNLRYNTRNLRFDQQRPPVDFGSGDRTRYQFGIIADF